MPPTISAVRPAPPRRREGSTPRPQRGFSLLEVLMALFILTIGIIMCVTVFPVAGDWTRQTTEHAVAQNIAQNAVVILQSRLNAQTLFTLTGKFVPASSFGIAAQDRAYRYGNDHPATGSESEAQSALYFWDGLLRHHPAEPLGSVDALILVFKKGETTQHFGLRPLPEGVTSDLVLLPNQSSDFAPDIWLGPYRNGSEIPPLLHPPYNPKIFPPIGDFGIGEKSGTVFRQRLSADPAVAAPTIPLVTFDGHIENVFCSPPADDTDASPLIYVYQTILTF